MGKRYQLTGKDKTGWLARALMALMAAGTFADAMAQTRPRGEGQPQPGVATYKIDCPREESKKVTLHALSHPPDKPGPIRFVREFSRDYVRGF